MSRLGLFLLVPLLWVGCNDDSPSLDQIISNAESNATQKQINQFAAKCDNPENDQEVALTYNAMKVALGVDSCVQLGQEVLRAQELSLQSANISDLSPLIDLKNLSVLNLSNNRISDISPIAELRNITSLNMGKNKISDLSPLSTMVAMASLDVSRNVVRDVSPLENLYNLISLNLENNIIEDITPLNQLDKLVDFQMNDNILGTELLKTGTNCPLAIDAAPTIREWCTLRNQVRGFLSFCDNYANEPAAIQKTVDKLKGFQSCAEADAALNELTRLDLSVEIDQNFIIQDPDSRLTDISPIANLTNLVELNLDFNNITNVEPISYLTSLRGLSMRGNGISDISSFSYLESLVSLDLAINKIKDISAVRQMRTITALVLNLNEVEDVSPIEELQFLGGVGFEDNNITNINPLANLPGMFVLDISLNNITTLAPIANMAVLTNFTYNCNPLGTTIASTVDECPTTNVGDTYLLACTYLNGLPATDADADPTNDRDSLTNAYCPAQAAARQGIRANLFN